MSASQDEAHSTSIDVISSGMPGENTAGSIDLRRRASGPGRGRPTREQLRFVALLGAQGARGIDARGTAGRVDGRDEYDGEQRRGTAGERDEIERLDLEEQCPKRAAERKRAGEAERA